MEEIVMKKREDIYNLYWYFAAERQNIFYKKLNGEKAPWTNDRILQEYKFCNSYRASDRVSQYLLKNVIYNGKKYSKEDTIFRIVLFKIFNKEATWELFIDELGDVKLNNFEFKKYCNILQKAKDRGEKIYTDAYMSCATKAYGYEKKHENHIALIEEMFVKDKLQDKIINSKTMEEAFNYIKGYPLIGDFMAYQLITDINYSEAVNFSEMEFTVVGPGSRRGIAKCFTDLEGMSKQQVIMWMCEHQEEEFKRLGINFKSLGGRKLQYIDCQNLFCELDKYLRKAKPELKSNRTNIKKKYVPKKEKIEYLYPPKWNIVI